MAAAPDASPRSGDGGGYAKHPGRAGRGGWAGRSGQGGAVGQAGAGRVKDRSGFGGMQAAYRICCLIGIG